MEKTKKHPVKKWEISILEIEENGSIKYKVTKKVSDLTISETKFFDSKRDAIEKFNEWLE